MQRKELIIISNNKLNSNILNKIIKAVIDFKKTEKGIKYKRLINNNELSYKYKKLINNNKLSYKCKRLINNNEPFYKCKKLINNSECTELKEVIKFFFNIIKYIYKK